MSIYSTETVSTAGPTLDDLRRIVREFDEAMRCTIGKPTVWLTTRRELERFRRAKLERFRRTETDRIAAEQRGWPFVAGVRPLLPALALLVVT